MARVNIYLADELHSQVKAAGIPVSEVCQRALRIALEGREANWRHLDVLRRQKKSLMIRLRYLAKDLEREAAELEAETKEQPELLPTPPRRVSRKRAG